MLNKVGTSIGKLLAMLWFPDASVVQHLLSTVADIGSDSFSKELEKRKVNRFFADCADEILDKAQDFIDIEFRKISKERTKVLFDDLANAIENYVSTEVILKNDRSPEKLEVALISKISGYDKYEQTEKDFIDLFTKIISQYICQFVEGAPDYVPKSLTAIIDNQRDLKTLLNTVLNEIIDIKTETKKGAFVRAVFYEKVKNNLGQLEIFGLSIYSIKKKYPLKTAYISLNVAFEDQVEIKNSSYTSIEEFLSYGNILLIQGGAGSGKTTLLQWVALQIAQKTLPEELEERYANNIPVFIKLRFVENFNGTSFFEAAKKSLFHMYDGIEEKYLVDKADDGKVVFLIDGYDEVAEEERLDASNWIEGLVAQYKHCKCLITSRPVASLNSLEYLNDINVASLEEMGLSDIRNFINYWHEAVGSGIVNEEVMERMSMSKIRLLDAVNTTLGIRSLSSNPLMCAVLCTINLDRNTYIPTEKYNIYLAAIDLLLNRRDSERGIKSQYYNQVSPRDREFIFQGMARWMTLNEKLEIGIERIEEIIYKTHPNDNTSEISKAFIERSGMLCLVGPNNVTFIHKQFQEFFAAKSFIEEDDIGLILSNIEKDSWQEIIVLACSQMNKTQGNNFISHLMEREKTREISLMIVICREFIERLEDKLYIDTEKIAENVFPPESMNEVQRLSVLGDKFIPLIQNNMPMVGEKTNSLFARALIQLGNSDALHILTTLAKQAEQSTAEQLVIGWDKFDREEYGEKVIQHIQCPYSITWEDIENLECLRYAQKATIIKLKNCKGERLLEYLPENKDCVSLEVILSDDLETLSGISKLPNLIDVKIIKCETLFDLNSINHLKGLINLTLTDCPSLSNIEGIKGCKLLQKINFKGAASLEDINELSYCREIIEIDFDDCYSIRTWDALLYLDELETITVPNVSAFDDFPPEFTDNVDIF